MSIVLHNSQIFIKYNTLYAEWVYHFISIVGLCIYIYFQCPIVENQKYLAHRNKSSISKSIWYSYMNIFSLYNYIWYYNFVKINIMNIFIFIFVKNIEMDLYVPKYYIYLFHNYDKSVFSRTKRKYHHPNVQACLWILFNWSWLVIMEIDNSNAGEKGINQHKLCDLLRN